MIYLKNLRNKSLPFYYVDLNPKKIDELKRMVKQAKDPQAKQNAMDALMDF